MTHSNSAHPRESRDPSGLSALEGRSRRTPESAWVPAFAGMSGILGCLIPTTALAHPGDHLGMGVAQVVHHIVTSPDHLAEVVMAGLMVVGLLIRQRRRAR